MFRTRTRPQPALQLAPIVLIALANGAVVIEPSTTHVAVKVSRRADGSIRIQTRRTES